MLAKKVARGMVPWSQSRKHFHLRLSRKMKVSSLVRRIQKSDSDLENSKDLVENWFIEDLVKHRGISSSDGARLFRNNDGEVIEWITKHEDDIQSRIMAIGEARSAKLIPSTESSQRILESFMKMAPNLNAEDRLRVLQAMNI